MKTTTISFRNILPIMAMLSAIFFTTQKIAAQEIDNKKTAEERAKLITDKMKTSLSLDDDQYQKAQAINLKYAKKNEEIKNSTSGKLAKFRSFKASKENKKKEMKAILSAEQFKKYEEMMQEIESEAKDAYKNRQG